MKQLLALSILTAAVCGLTACQQDPQSANPNTTTTFSSGTSSLPASPVFVMNRSVAVRSGGSSYSEEGIAVMDSNGGHLTQIYTNTSGMGGTPEHHVSIPTWSPDGSSVAWIETDGDAWVWKIRSIDVSVSNGSVVTSNLRTLYTSVHSDSMRATDPSWCSVSGTGLIAFPRYKPLSGTVDLCTISTAGGTPSVLYTRTDSYTRSHQILCPTWNFDDSKIGFADMDSAGVGSLKTIDAATGTLGDSLGISGYLAANCLEWSRSGSDVIAFRKTKSSGNEIAYWTPSSGTITSSGLAGDCPTWNPNNSYVYFSNGANFYHSAALSTSETLITSSMSGSYARRKR